MDCEGTVRSTYILCALLFSPIAPFTNRVWIFPSKEAWPDTDVLVLGSFLYFRTNHEVYICLTVTCDQHASGDYTHTNIKCVGVINRNGCGVLACVYPPALQHLSHALVFRLKKNQHAVFAARIEIVSPHICHTWPLVMREWTRRHQADYHTSL